MTRKRNVGGVYTPKKGIRLGLSINEMAKRESVSRDRIYGVLHGLGICPAVVAKGNQGPGGGSPARLLTADQVALVHARLQAARKAGILGS